MASLEEVVSLVEKLAGQRVPFVGNLAMLQAHDPFAHGGIGCSQLNELLLTLGYDRVTPAFFRYLFKGKSTVTSYGQLAEGIEQFRKHAMLLYGNIKFAFKSLCAVDHEKLVRALRSVQSVPVEDYTGRHQPLHKIKRIEPQDAYYLGYVVEREIAERLAADPTNREILTARERLEGVRRIGRENHDAYLTYDHMDVYVATSMREAHEFYMVSGFIAQLFEHEEVKPLNLRWFDPTQAYCEDRIDKGLVEGLMVKRSKCTIYHVQESDTLGKDSELAATLAQGKPVIAYVPRFSNKEAFANEAMRLAGRLYPGAPVEDLIRRLLPRYYPEGAWTDPIVKGWLSGSDRFDVDHAFDLLFEKARDLYEKRARTLCESHPLALQVNLATGVANGVLVVRTVADCAKLLRRILLNTMEFDIQEPPAGEKGSLLLRERISGCIFRVVTCDDLLTNSFWNFYLDEPSVPVV